MILYASNFKDTEVFLVEVSKSWEADGEIKLAVSDMHIILPRNIEILWKILTKSIKK